MDRRTDAKNLKSSTLLKEALDGYRAFLIERWEDASDVETREQAHAGMKALKELRERLDDRIDAALGDERDDAAE